MRNGVDMGLDMGKVGIPNHPVPRPHMESEQWRNPTSPCASLMLDKAAGMMTMATTGQGRVKELKGSTCRANWLAIVKTDGGADMMAKRDALPMPKGRRNA